MESDMRLIDDWKTSYKKYSVIAGAAVGFTAIDQVLPDLLTVWQPLIPESVYPYAVAVLATATIIGRVIKQ
jgi:hypothetical protein